MASQVDAGELERVRARLRTLVHWRDRLACELANVEAEIATDARAFATMNGDFVKPSLDQLRRMLFDERSTDG